MTKNWKIAAASLAALSFGLATPAAAASLIIDANGQLRGASDVNVGGTLYDVEFADGTCIEIFSGCDEVSDFTFTNYFDAREASQALLDQVFLGEFNDDPTLTFGCDEMDYCRSLNPYTFVDFGDGLRTRDNTAVNGSIGINDYTTDFYNRRDLDLSTRSGFNYAVFSLADGVGAVPEPGTWLMMLLGFGFVGGMMRQRKQDTRVSYT